MWNVSVVLKYVAYNIVSATFHTLHLMQCYILQCITAGTAQSKVLAQSVSCKNLVAH